MKIYFHSCDIWYFNLFKKYDKTIIVMIESIYLQYIFLKIRSLIIVGGAYICTQTL